MLQGVGAHFISRLVGNTQLRQRYLKLRCAVPVRVSIPIPRYER